MERGGHIHQNCIVLRKRSLLVELLFKKHSIGVCRGRLDTITDKKTLNYVLEVSLVHVHEHLSTVLSSAGLCSWLYPLVAFRIRDAVLATIVI